jgi:hypothetical protein
MKSEIRVRHEGNELAPIANLIVHHSSVNTFNQTAKFVRILDIGKETFDCPLLYQQFEFSQNGFQFPSDPCLSDSTPDIEEQELTVPVPSSLSLL